LDRDCTFILKLICLSPPGRQCGLCSFRTTGFFLSLHFLFLRLHFLPTLHTRTDHPNDARENSTCHYNGDSDCVVGKGGKDWFRVVCRVRSRTRICDGYEYIIHMHRTRYWAGHAVRIYKKFVYIEIDTHDSNKLHIICTPCKMLQNLCLIGKI